MAGSHTQEFVRAVMLSFDVTADPALRSSANASLEQLRQAEDGWLFCLQVRATRLVPDGRWCTRRRRLQAALLGGCRVAAFGGSHSG